MGDKGRLPQQQTREQQNSQCKSLPNVFPMLRNRQVNLSLPLHNKQQKIFQIHTKLIQASSRLLPASRFGTILLPSKISQARLGEWGRKASSTTTNKECRQTHNAKHLLIPMLRNRQVNQICLLVKMNRKERVFQLHAQSSKC